MSGPRRCAGALIALAAVVGGAPRPALADCMPWMGAHEARALSSQLELLDRLDAHSHEAMPRPQPSPAVPGPRPCSGPLCSKAPALPTPAPVASIPWRVDTWACLAIAAPPPGATGTLLPRRREPARAVLAPPSIDRPPRASLLHLS